MALIHWVKNSVNKGASLIGFGAPFKDADKNLNKYRGIAQLVRVKVDPNYWREAIFETERPYLPFRVKMQTIFKDTVLNGHVAACLERRYSLTMLREFAIVDDGGNVNEEWTKYFQKEWFSNLIHYILQAPQFGYSLISLGDYVRDEFPNLTICTRENTSPDRLVYAKFPYTPTGLNFTEEPYSDWHIWVPTPSEFGISDCGYGLLYKVAFYEILVRGNIANNANYNQLFGMPIRWVKTPKTNEDEVAELQAYMENMGSQSYLITDLTEELQLIETKSGGKGADTYSSLEKRCYDIISKIELGHANALDEQSGKLGAGQGEDNPVHAALRDIQSKDGKFVENVVNNQFLPKLRNIGISFPEGFYFKFKNDDEKEELRRREDESNMKTAEIFQTIKNAGGKPDWKYFQERTGIPVEEAPEPVVAPPIAGKAKEVQDKLKRIYGKHKH